VVRSDDSWHAVLSRGKTCRLFTAQSDRTFYLRESCEHECGRPAHSPLHDYSECRCNVGGRSSLVARPACPVPALVLLLQSYAVVGGDHCAKDSSPRCAEDSRSTPWARFDLCCRRTARGYAKVSVPAEHLSPGNCFIGKRHRSPPAAPTLPEA